jgi:putative tryptophan/tyrosine transport system substrate-binding protein
VRHSGANLGVAIIEKPARSASDVEEALRNISKETVDGIFIVPSGLFTEPCKRIAAIAIQERLPWTGCDLVDDAGLLSYTPDGYRAGHRGAWYVDRILKGAIPAKLPVEQPTKFDLVINLKAAKQIGLTIPPNVLARADKVIK